MSMKAGFYRGTRQMQSKKWLAMRRYEVGDREQECSKSTATDIKRQEDANISKSINLQ